MNSEIFLEKTHQKQLDEIRKNSQEVLFQMLIHHYKTPGKMLRPLFGFKLAGALGLNPEIAIPWCAACEMLHNATLIHDDLQDGDTIRRGQPTVWKVFGSNQAINAGDFLLTLPPKIILESPSSDEIKMKLIEEFSTTSSRIVEGQSIEFTLPQKVHSKEIKELYERCISYKTSQLFVGVAKGIAFLSKQEASKVESIEIAFRELGNIFQIQDDLLDLYGDKQRGNFGNDIKEGKISSLMVSYLSLYPNDDFKILEVLLKNRTLTTQDEVLYVKDIFSTKGPLSSSLDSISNRVEILRSLELTQNNEEFRNLVFKSLVKTLSPIQHLFEGKKFIQEQTWNF